MRQKVAADSADLQVNSGSAGVNLRALPEKKIADLISGQKSSNDEYDYEQKQITCPFENLFHKNSNNTLSEIKNKDIRESCKFPAM